MRTLALFTFALLLANCGSCEEARRASDTEETASAAPAQPTQEAPRQLLAPSQPAPPAASVPNAALDPNQAMRESAQRTLQANLPRLYGSEDTPRNLRRLSRIERMEPAGADRSERMQRFERSRLYDRLVNGRQLSDVPAGAAQSVPPQAPTR